MNRILINFILCFVALLIFYCSEKERTNQNQNSLSNPLVSDRTTYELINSILSQQFNKNKLLGNNILDRNLHPHYLSTFDSLEIVSMDSLFKREDILFIFEQQAKSKDFKLNPVLVKNGKVVSTGSVLAKKGNKKVSFITAYKEEYGKLEFFFVGMPLFTKDQSVAIIEVGKICGMTCGKIETLIYKKKDKRWEPIFTLVESPEI